MEIQLQSDMENDRRTYGMNGYRTLTDNEIAKLEQQGCTAKDWRTVEVSDGFSTDYIRYVRFSGNVRLGAFEKDFPLPGGIVKHSGLYHVTLHNVTVGDNCCIENVKNYIANYEIGDDCFIENVDIILTDGVSTFGNGVKVSVLNETGGREVSIFDRLTAQSAYLMAVGSHDEDLSKALDRIVESYASAVASSVGRIGNNVTIADAGYIKNVRVGDHCKIEGSSRLKNGSLNSNAHAPIHIGVGVIADDFIVCSGSSVEDGVTISRCFIGQACRLGHNYSATDSLFFSNCQGENGEACAIFAGPYTVTHHKSTLLIAGMFSFMNAGSGSNQSNHLYKLGPIHQGILERGAKTASDSYILWPARVGAFSLVMGRHVNHNDTSDLPFSYLIEQQSTTYIVPGANLKSVGTIRDAKKWPRRDGRKDPDMLDSVNCNLLSPYTIQKMMNAVEILESLRRTSGDNSATYSYQSAVIKHSSLVKGLKYYSLAIDKFLGNSLVTRLMNSHADTLEGLREDLLPLSSAHYARFDDNFVKVSAVGGSGEDGPDKASRSYGTVDYVDGLDGNWVDISGLIAPESLVNRLVDDLKNGRIDSAEQMNSRFAAMHSMYYEYEWGWAFSKIRSRYGINLLTAEPADLVSLVERWRDSVISLDKLVYEDAKKEFSFNFEQFRDSDFETNDFVKSIVDHIEVKSRLAEDALSKLRSLS